MTDSTILGYAKTIMDTRLDYFFAAGNIPTNNASGTTLYFIASQFLAYAGAAFVFIMSFLGGLQTAEKTITWIEDGFADFLQHYGNQDYNFQELIKNSDTNKTIEDLLTSYAVSVIAYSLGSFWHALFLLVIGWIAAEIIFNKIKTLITASADVAINDGVRLMLFGIVSGSLNYIGGQLVGAKAEIIISMLGFNTRPDDSSQTTSTSTTSTTGATTTSSSSTFTGRRPKDFITLYELSQNWELLYTL